MALIAKAPEQKSSIDYDAINRQIDEDVHDARISLIVDLGTQEKETVVRGADEDFGWATYFLDEDDAFDAIDKAEDIVGDYLMQKNDWNEQPEEVEVTKELLEGDLKKQKLEVEEGDTVYKVNFCIHKSKPSQEVVYVYDLVDTYVDYGFEGQEPLQYRHYGVRRNFKTGHISGIGLSAERKDGKEVLRSMSTHAKLAKMVGKPEIIKSCDITGLLNQPVGIPVEHNDKGEKLYLKFKSPQALSKKQLKMGVTELDCEPVVVDFDSVTAEILEKAKLRKDIVEKIKSALNYEGSQMQKAMEEFEKNKAASREEKEEDSTDDKPKKTKKKEDKKAKKAKAKPPVEEESVEEDDDDMSDFFDEDE
jgi:hypothetical protein